MEKVPSAGFCQNYNAGRSPLYLNTSLLPPVTHFLSDRALQTGSPGCSEASRRRYECTNQPSGCAAVVLPLISRYESPQRCTQGKNHFYFVSVARKLKLATPLKWAACAPAMKHYFHNLFSGICVSFASGKSKVNRGRFERRGGSLAGLTLRWHCVQEDLWQRSRRHLIL